MSEENNQYTFENPEYRHTYWHTCSHVLAQAMKRLHPEVKLAIGPAIENGFYYDFDTPEPFSETQLTELEAEMRKICKEKLKLERFELPRMEAIQLHGGEGRALQGGAHPRPARGRGHLLLQAGGVHRPVRRPPSGLHRAASRATPSSSPPATPPTGGGTPTGRLSSASTAWPSPRRRSWTSIWPEIEEAKKRDHRKLGRELGLFMLRDEGPGFPFFLPKGMVLKNTLLDYWRQVHKKYGYVEISTPIMLNRQLWERSGHWDHYKNNMYTTVIDDVDFAVKPMNCPGGMLVYSSEPHSYRDLPLRVGEIGLVHRHELSGALHGLFRVRCFNQDDAHVFMTRDQMQDVIQETVRLFDEVYSTFGLSYTIELSTMPEDHIGTVEEWERNQDILKSAITDMGKDFVINEGDGAFYGPKLDFHLADSLGRTWQCGTIQLDSQLPERFELEYTGEDGEKHRPVMIHRVVLGSIERFIGVITEHFAGAFPAWLSPVQVKILPVTDRAAEYADQVSRALDGQGFRVETDHRSEKIGKKIREATLEKVPYHAGGGRPGHGKRHRLCPPSHRRGPGCHVSGILRPAAGRRGRFQIHRLSAALFFRFVSGRRAAGTAPRVLSHPASHLPHVIPGESLSLCHSEGAPATEESPLLFVILRRAAAKNLFPSSVLLREYQRPKNLPSFLSF